MSDLLKIALAAYLLGALFEGILMIGQLSHSLPDLVKSAEHQSLEHSPKNNQFVLIIVALVSLVGAFSWPCRLIHRSMKE